MAKAKTEQIDLPLAVSEAQVEGLITSLPIDKIAVSPRALRDDEVVADIAASISIDGLLTPITVRMVPAKEEPVRRLRFNDTREGGPSPGGYQVVAGHRRLAALRSLGWTDVPVRVLKGVDDEASFRLSLAENLKRLDLNPMEEAKAFRRAVDELGWSEAKVAKAVGRSVSYVRDRLGLLRLPGSLQELVKEGLPAAKAQAIAPVARLAEGDAVLQQFDLNDTAHNLEREVKRVLRTKVVPIEGWDSEICKAAGCLGDVDGKAVCTNPSHAYAVVAEAKKDDVAAVVEEAKAKLSAPDGSPVYFNLEALLPVDKYAADGMRILPPEAYPACPLPLANYYDFSQGVLAWDSLQRLVRGKPFRENCLNCPAWKGKGAGRAIFVEATWPTYDDSSRKLTATLVCMDATCRREQAKLSTDEAPKSDAAKALKKEAETGVAAAHVEELEQRLGKDPLRTLAAYLVHRYKMSELPDFPWGLRSIAEEMGIKVPAHDKTPNGVLKAVMGIGADELNRLMAGFVVRTFDNAHDDLGWHINRVVATTEVLYGPEAAEDLKAKAKAARDAAVPQPDLSQPLKESVKKARARSKTKAKTEAFAKAFDVLADGRFFCSACMEPFVMVVQDRCPAGHGPDGSPAEVTS